MPAPVGAIHASIDALSCSSSSFCMMAGGCEQCVRHRPRLASGQQHPRRRLPAHQASRDSPRRPPRPRELARLAHHAGCSRNHGCHIPPWVHGVDCGSWRAGPGRLGPAAAGIRSGEGAPGCRCPAPWSSGLRELRQLRSGQV
jgi:hypothetical protein